ncbi:nucleoside monophosphate kinase [Candidatus Micrarchaeota archaeon]|nr:nucleoside monophosphate kinase [Candidatus Micrarchaeota archaeon]
MFKMIIILFGAPGSGKGTLAKRLEKQGLGKHVSTGDLFRREIANGTQIGKKLRTIINAGKLVNDEDTLELLRRELSAGSMLDGYPRTLKQVSDLDELLKQRGESIKLVINVYADAKLIVDRIVNRLVCTKCRAIYNAKYAPPKTSGKCDNCGGELIHREDDNEETIRTRIAEYENKTKPIMEHYRKKGLVMEIDSSDENAVAAIKSALR